MQIFRMGFALRCPQPQLWCQGPIHGRLNILAHCGSQCDLLAAGQCLLPAPRCSWCIVLADHSALHMAGTSRHHPGCSSQLSAAVETPSVDVESHQPPALCRLWVLLPGAGLYFAASPEWHPNGGRVFSTGPRRQYQATPGKGHFPGGWSRGGSEESEETAGDLEGFSLP